MSCWSNKVGWIAPWLISALIAGPRSSVIQSSSAGMPDLAQRAGPPLERGAGDVIQHQRPAGQVPGGQSILDLLLAGQQPVHRLIQVVLIAGLQAQHLTQRT